MPRLRNLLTVLGAGLLLLNVWGQVWPADLALKFKHAGRRPNNSTPYADMQSTLREIDRLPIRQRIDRLTMLVHERMTNPQAKTISFGSMRVPAAENWLLALAGRAGLAPYHDYTFADPMASLRRGTGLCYQQALTLVGLLEARGIAASVQGLNGHVVARATVEGTEYLLDPDYGLVLPFSPAQVRLRWAEVAPLYRERIAAFVDADLGLRHQAALAETYAAPPPPPAPPGIAGSLTAAHIAKERLAYQLKWAIPLLLLLLSGFLAVLNRLPRRPQATCGDGRPTTRAAG